MFLLFSPHKNCWCTCDGFYRVQVPQISHATLRPLVMIMSYLVPGSLTHDDSHLLDPNQEVDKHQKILIPQSTASREFMASLYSPLPNNCKKKIKRQTMSSHMQCSVRPSETIELGALNLWWSISLLHTNTYFTLAWKQTWDQRNSR